MFEFKAKKRYKPIPIALKLIVFLSLLIINSFFIYYIYVNIVIKNSPIHQVYSDGKILVGKEEIADVSNNIINKLPQKLLVKFEGDSFEIPTTELKISTNKDEIINYGKGDYLKVLTEAVSLLKGDRLQIKYNLDPSIFLKKTKFEFQSSNPCQIGSNNYLNYSRASFNFKINTDKLTNLIKDALNTNTVLEISLRDILNNSSDYNIFVSCKKYTTDIDKIQQAINKIDKNISAEDLFNLKIKDNESIWEIKDYALLKDFLSKYKSRTDSLADNGSYITQDNKILLSLAYKQGSNLDIDQTISNTSKWINKITDEYPLYINYTDPEFFKYKKEILDFTQLMGVGKTRIDLIRNGEKNSVVPYTVFGLQEVENKIIYPNEEFSYLKTIQPQTNGLTKAGRPIAPGICNSTTTLFRAMLESGYQITDRSYHESYVPSYEWGYPYNIVDAAYLTNPEVDFKFINDSNYPILIKITFERDANWQFNSVFVYSSSKAKKRSVQLSNWKIWDKNSPTKFKGSFDRVVLEDNNIIRKETFFSHYL